MINQVFTAAILCLFSQVTLPTDAKVAQGRLLKLSAISESKVIKWINVDDNADLIVSDSGKWAIFSSTVAGKYKVFCWTSVNNIPSEAAVCVITVGDLKPTPINSELLNSLKLVFEKIDAPDKKTSLESLKKAYQSVLTMLDNDQIKTTADFLLQARAAAKKHITADSLLPLREVIANDLDMCVPTDPSSIFTDKIRSNVRDKFSLYINLLGQI